VPDPVIKVDRKAGNKPNDKPDPSDLGKRQHEASTEGDPEKRDKRHKGASEGSAEFWMGLTQDDHTATDDCEGKQGTDVAQLRGGADVDEAGEGGDDHAGYDL